MRTYMVTIILAMTLVGCGKTDKEKPEMSEMAIKDLELNEVVHDSLTTKQINDIKRIHAVFSEVILSSLEETITNFKRDQHPDKEIAIWLRMADAYDRFTSQTDREIGLDKKNEAYELILFRSMMTEHEVLERLKLEVLTKDEVTEVFSYYTDTPKPVTVEME